MAALLVFILSTFIIFLAGQLFDTSLAVTQEHLSLSSLQPLLGDFRRQVKTICHREQGRLDCPPAPPPSNLHIFSAIYGQDFKDTNCNTVYSPFNRQVLRETCQFQSVLREATRYCANRNPCKMRSNQFRINSNTCQSVPKYLQLEYTCLPVNKYTQFICADSYVEVQCDNVAERLLVISARLTSNYTHKTSHCRQYNRNIPESMQCPEDDVTNEVKAECHMKSSCSVVSPPTTVFRNPKCPKLNTILEYVCVNRKLLRRGSRPKQTHTPSRTRKPRPTEKYIPKLLRPNRPIYRKDPYPDYTATTLPPRVHPKKEEEVDEKYYWLRIGLIAAGVLLFTIIVGFGICQIVLRRRNRQKRAKMIRDIARQKVEDDFVKKHLGPPTSWSFPSPVSSTNGDRLNMSESWMEPTDRLIMYDWPLRKSYHGDQNPNSSLNRKKQQQQQSQPPQTTTTTQEQTEIDASLPHFYHM